MQPEEAAEFQKYLKNIIVATQNGSMSWEAVNPTTYIWKKGTGLHTRIVLQRTGANPRTYSFQGIDATNTPQISQAAISVTSLGATFDELFLAISRKIDQKGLDFLKSLVPPTS